MVDLDNTLWGGVIGDDGLSGIQIGELGSGHAFTEFQFWLKAEKPGHLAGSVQQEQRVYNKGTL